MTIRDSYDDPFVMPETSAWARPPKQIKLSVETQEENDPDPHHVE